MDAELNESADEEQSDGGSRRDAGDKWTSLLPMDTGLQEYDESERLRPNHKITLSLLNACNSFPNLQALQNNVNTDPSFFQIQTAWFVK